MTLSIRVEINIEVKMKVEANHIVVYTIVSTVASPTVRAIVQLLAKSAKSVDVTTILNWCAEVVQRNVSHSRHRTKKGIIK